MVLLLLFLYRLSVLFAQSFYAGFDILFFILVLWGQRGYSEKSENSLSVEIHFLTSVLYEPPHGKTNNLHRRKQRRR